MWFARSDTGGRMQGVRRMAELVQRERVIKRAAETYPEHKYEYMDEQLTINALKKQVAKEISEWDQQNNG